VHSVMAHFEAVAAKHGVDCEFHHKRGGLPRCDSVL
jgi:hypothetical protein